MLRCRIDRRSRDPQPKNHSLHQLYQLELGSSRIMRGLTEASVRASHHPQFLEGCTPWRLLEGWGGR